jgi:two-component system sensor histidine kinase KdpD
MNFQLFKYRYYFVSFVLLVIITVVSQLLRSHLDLINIALIHLVPVIVIALRGIMGATMMVTTVAVVMFDWLYVPPQYSFDVHDLNYIWSFIIFFLVGYTITLQAKRIHANEIKEMLLNTLSHDLKTPLSSILGNATLLEETTLDEKTRQEVLMQIKDSSQRMNRLIGNLLDSARLQHNQVSLQKEWCDLEDLIGVALQEFRHESKRKRPAIRIVGDPQLFWADCGLLVRLLVNLIDNAFKYSEEDRRIRITLSSTGQDVRILFCNESGPIRSEDLKNMFERFYRLGNTADISGSGIGLSICKDIVTAHQGKIEAYNVKDGVCFEVTLPVLKYPSKTLKELP